MSPCSRGAISRALRLGSLRWQPKPCNSFLRTTTLPALRTVQSQISSGSIATQIRNHHRCFSTTHFKHQETSSKELADALPLCCPGCGAFTQTIEPEEPGYYGGNRKQTRKLLASRKKTTEKETMETEVTGATELTKDTEAAEAAEAIEVIEATEMNEATEATEATESAPGSQENVPFSTQSLESPDRNTQVCDRCHDLLHHNKAVSSPKPSILSIREYINESPHKHNRVYHILDAADFPMSLVPRIHWALFAQEQRSRNRRSNTEKYHHGQKMPTISFIITRSDLLAATKEQVDSKMEYVRSILRNALGKSGQDVRLGNVHMISAHRGWWTKQVKEEIREHGGGIWVVGKANVGKSSFIEACFPKDSRREENMAEWMAQREKDIENQRQTTPLNPDSLLPPAPREDLYPVLPIVSSLPGTTVSPIRIPFGRGRGEMIDLPGMERSELEDHVRDEHKRDLIMTKRIKPERCTLKPGQSLLLGGGLIRISAVNPEDTVMAATFVPIESHVTNTAKAIEIQAEQKPYRGKALMIEGTGSTMASAGQIDLKWDITASNLPTSVAKAVKDKGIPIPHLPYRVMAADILIEGCGWIEVSIQVRNKRGSENEPPVYPQVEVFSPKGEYIGARRPIECWNFMAEKIKADKRKRPRTRHQYS
ncbi:hypothetical protein N7466_004513 [Penicillium verhagenii]|uniref:uncharacterized protein n=1 Tax=Penicillium verhagenii TaxID=1562060 RepID=UPI002544DB18|nr:uncharacterized protein N7466_004513 [Penicillium verhagenii]KAJ5934966.1 hypothetical protein N7466_004513 [Penicillium verhagenii]